ncbi:MAG: hypothetical protein JXJ17_13335 [Anaerolineae bacterium]|nr:hypothetical protein [Anaerolineae bacterium]
MSIGDYREGVCFVTGVHSEKLKPCVVYTARIVSSNSYSYSSSSTTTSTVTTTRYDDFQRHEVDVDVNTLQDWFRRDIAKAKRVFWISTGVIVVVGILIMILGNAFLGSFFLLLAPFGGTGISKGVFAETESGKVGLTFSVLGHNEFTVSSLCGPKLVAERVKASREKDITWLSEATYKKLR